MSEPIGPGDWVECVTTDPRPLFGLPQVRAGSLYRVVLARDTGNLCTMANCNTTMGLSLEIDPPDAGGAHCACVFRPIYRPRASLIEALKAPVARTPKVVKKAREDA